MSKIENRNKKWCFDESECGNTKTQNCQECNYYKWYNELDEYDKTHKQ